MPEISSIATSADRAVKAGILFELAGERKRAEEAWKGVEKRFPPERCGFYALLAKDLRSDRPDNLEDMVFHAQIRSEMFYLCALLFEKRENEKRSHELLELCVKEDPTLRWPAFLARQKLTGKA